jgi:hypothetical protein
LLLCNKRKNLFEHLLHNNPLMAGDEYCVDVFLLLKVESSKVVLVDSFKEASGVAMY